MCSINHDLKFYGRNDFKLTKVIEKTTVLKLFALKGANEEHLHWNEKQKSHEMESLIEAEQNSFNLRI